MSFTPPIVVAEFDRNSRERVRITLDRYAGRDIVDVRAWYRDGDQWKPTKQGVTTQISNLPTLAAGLAAALDRAIQLGLVERCP